MKGKIIFKEEQTFVGTWMWYLVIGIALLLFIGTILGIIFRPDNEGVIGLILATAATGGVLILLYTSKLYVSIDKNSIYFRYPPFVNKEKKLTKDDVIDIYIRKYKPIWEYGGWGYRFRFRSGRAMSVAGNVGLQLTTKDNKRILIGTQKPELMKQAVRRLKENWEIDG
ncbi:hypothetical protein SAMN05421640_2546 [Ekhidna lutea]|uniref:Uncharacterized protein n=1 Tax=Ekhidna lutea TaxID=447679 RepID=A0A239KE73_EKHLU|nr:hypothetical protein [Ekhidna lutea]SNT15414.1 hypothetical protein SAMN05421640_2546 [Ekhidna lutea]